MDRGRAGFLVYAVTVSATNHKLDATNNILEDDRMNIIRPGSRPSAIAPTEHFTGRVRVDPVFQAEDPAGARGSYVTFEPGARTNWHTHPAGQTLIITAGCGRVQSWGAAVETVRPGDVIWFSAGEKHWHGAGPDTAMTHLAIVEPLDGKTADWLEKVTDVQYLG
jgi:quercetin dioxygenase-like cupin family protein